MKKIFWLGLLLVPSIALAGNTPEKHDKKSDGIVCRDLEETGSRLSSKRVCMTREEWEVARRDARVAIEQAQTRQMNEQGH